MTRKKRDRNDRAFHNGYVAGIKGHSVEVCPFSQDFSKRELWLGGWREGWDEFKHMKP